MPENRPNFNQPLDRLTRENEQSRRGKLKIFFGASVGVGTTYAMISTARQLRLEGLDVVAGVVETHGRRDTLALLDGIEQMPLKEILCHDKFLKELDLDCAIKRRPALILVDELAHSNAEGSRHPKRWQDVEELLSSGIDVFTTVAVQHLESLNDVIGDITGVRVWNTVPDKIFDGADEVVLVDLPPDEILQRLKEGKVYLPQPREQTIQDFFRKGNLIALRELAMRRAADRVGGEMQAYRRGKSIAWIWQTRESLLACLGAEPGNEKIIRTAGRIAAQMRAPWHAVYIETPKLQRLPETRRQEILETLKLAQNLGAETTTLSAMTELEAVIEYARNHNLTKVVVGNRRRSPWVFWQRSLADRLGQLAPDLDVVQVSYSGETDIDPKASPAPLSTYKEKNKFPWSSYFLSVVACGITTFLVNRFFDYFIFANVVVIFMLTVVLVAIKLGRGPSLLASFLCVGAIFFFFVPPRFSYAISDLQYLLTLAAMLIIAFGTVELTAGLRFQAKVAMQRESRAQALYEMARELSGAVLPEQITRISYRFIEMGFGTKSTILLPDKNDRLHLSSPAIEQLPPTDLKIAQWVFDHGEEAGFGTNTMPDNPFLYLPLKAPMRIRGVLVLKQIRAHWLMIPEQRRLLETFGALTAITLERMHYVDKAHDALVSIESERLRNSILAAISHDIRTPLTTLIGMASLLKQTQPDLSAKQKDIATDIFEESLRINSLVNKLLDMARLQAGKVKLNIQWQSLEETVGSALKATEKILAGHQVAVQLPRDLPLLGFDAVLVERALANLLENAAKYSPAGSAIKIEGCLGSAEVKVSVSDNGPGLPPGSERTVFEKFTRVQQKSSTPGVGLGLSICRSIVEAHKGHIEAENLPSGGARFTFTLPTGKPPALEETEQTMPMDEKLT